MNVECNPLLSGEKPLALTRGSARFPIDRHWLQSNCRTVCPPGGDRREITSCMSRPPWIGLGVLVLLCLPVLAVQKGSGRVHLGTAEWYDRPPGGRGVPLVQAGRTAHGSVAGAQRLQGCSPAARAGGATLRTVSRLRDRGRAWCPSWRHWTWPASRPVGWPRFGRWPTLWFRRDRWSRPRRSRNPPGGRTHSAAGRAAARQPRRWPRPVPRPARGRTEPPDSRTAGDLHAPNPWQRPSRQPRRAGKDGRWVEDDEAQIRVRCRTPTARSSAPSRPSTRASGARCARVRHANSSDPTATISRDPPTRCIPTKPTGRAQNAPRLAGSRKSDRLHRPRARQEDRSLPVHGRQSDGRLPSIGPSPRRPRPARDRARMIRESESHSGSCTRPVCPRPCVSRSQYCVFEGDRPRWICRLRG